MDRPPTIRLTSPRFYAFLCAQFLGAANDNAFKVTIVMLILATVPGELAQVRYASLATALFPIPFLLFSPVAGYLADRFTKHRVLFWTKLPEVVAMSFAVLAFRWGNLSFLLFVLFLMATHSAMFSPAKYGIFPEVFDNKDLSLATGILEMTTNLAILSGSVAGVYVYSVFKSHLAYAGLTYLGVAVAGTIAICFAPRAPAGNPQARFAWNLLTSAGEDYAEVRRLPALFYTVLGLAYFGFLGSFFLTVIPIFAKNDLRLPEEVAGMLLAILCLGIGAGAIIAGRLSKGHVELGLVPLGALGLSVLAFDLAVFGRGSWQLPFGIPVRAGADLIGLGIAAGFFSVPLTALLQQRSPTGMKGRLIAFSNVLTFSAVLLSAAFLWVLTNVAGLATHTVILIVACMTVAGTAYVIHLLPDFLVRLILWLLTNTVYRVRVVGERNIPAEGALLVANHVSWADFLLISAACDRMIRFLMHRPYYEWKGLNWFLRRMHAIPVAGGDPPHKKEESLAIARAEIEQGHTVCIFAEGAITRTGHLLKFKRGLEHIAHGVHCPIVPVWLDGVWGSIFSFEGGKFFFKWPKHILAPVTVMFGPPLPPTASAFEVRQKIQELSVDAFRERKARQRPLHIEFVRTAKRRWRHPFVGDSTGRRLRFGEALVRAFALRDVIFAASRGTPERVGILLPSGVDAALVNIATLLAGKVPVNLDATPPGGMARAMIESGGLSRVITTRTFLQGLGFEGKLEAARRVDLEAMLAAVSARTSVARRLACRLLPAALVIALFVDGDTHNVDQIATVLHSYPPEAPHAPASALLTHHNLLSNLESLRQVFHVTDADGILGLLPFSNSIGFTATLWLPAVTGIGVVYAADLAGSDDLGRFCAAHNITLLPASPPLLTSVVQHVQRQQLSRLRFVAVGGGELMPETGEAFAAKFGVAPLEGYGCPECAPIVSLNVPDFRERRHLQIGSRAGTTGHPLPGISVRIVDPVTRAPLPPGAEGLLLVKGPNVMSGYLNDPERTSRVLIDGWFVTGDRAKLDDDGFLTVLHGGVGASIV